MTRTNIHASITLRAAECEPSYLGEGSDPGVLMVNLTRGSGGDYQALDAYLHGTPVEILDWCDKIARLVNSICPEAEHDYRIWSTDRFIAGLAKPAGTAIERLAVVRAIRPDLEPWCPEQTDDELYAAFMDWTTDGDTGRFVAYWNRRWEVSTDGVPAPLPEDQPTEADLVHAEHDEARHSAWGNDTVEPF